MYFFANKLDITFYLLGQNDLELLKNGWPKAITNLEDTTNYFIAKSTKGSSNVLLTDSVNIGLSSNQVSQLIDGIVSTTNAEYSRGSLQRSLGQIKHLKRSKVSSMSVFKNSQIKVLPNILNLPAGASKRLLEAIIPNSEISSEIVIKLAAWAMGNRNSLNETSVLLPVLKWINCILHYQLCEVQHLEKMYELLFQSLHIKNIVSITIRGKCTDPIM